MENLDNIIKQYQYIIFAAAVLIFTWRKIMLIRREISQLMEKSARAISSALIFGRVPDYASFASVPKAVTSDGCCYVPLAELAKRGEFAAYTAQLLKNQYINNIKLAAERSCDDQVLRLSLTGGFGLKPLEVYAREAA